MSRHPKVIVQQYKSTGMLYQQPMTKITEAIMELFYKEGKVDLLWVVKKRKEKKKKHLLVLLFTVATCSVTPATLTYRKGKLMNHSGKVKEQLLVHLLAYSLSGKCRNYCWEELQQLTSQRGCPPKPGVSAGFTRFPPQEASKPYCHRQGANF